MLLINFILPSLPSKRNEDFDQLYNLYLATTSEQDLMDKIKEICCDDSIEKPIKKEVSAVSSISLTLLLQFPCISFLACSITLFMSQNK